MKTEDFERLKAICEKEGFVVDCKYPDSGLVFVKKRDPWEGVEFVKILSGPRIWKITGMDASKIFVQDPVQGAFIAFSDAVPSTEQAYVDQLKKEAFERFGEIKVGQKFKDWEETVFEIDHTGFLYSKRNDQLRLGGWIIYQQGKWAELVKERVEVGFVWREDRILGKIMPVVAFHDEKAYDENYRVISLLDVKKPEEIAKAFKFLAQQLEKYLNNEIE